MFDLKLWGYLDTSSQVNLIYKIIKETLGI